jgi:hypothetical protein
MNIILKTGMLVALTIPQALMAQTIFSDTFTSDSSLGSEWYNLNNTTAASYGLNGSQGPGLNLTVASGTGKVNEMFAQFASSPVTLSQGEALTLTVDFNSPTGMATDTGGLLVGLYNDQNFNGQTPANEQGATGSTATGGPTAASQGYFGIMGYNTSAGTSTKFYSRAGGATAANELGYYSEQTSGTFTQLSSFAASGNSPLALNTAYQLNYTITDNGASGNSILATISRGSTTLDSWTSTDAAGTYDSFNELDFGNYGKATQVDLNILDESVTLATPEPNSLALLAGGLALLPSAWRRLQKRA